MKPGTITIRDNKLVITAPPHVSIRLQRLFGGAQRFKAGVFHLAATPEHAHDLEWFRERHPLVVETEHEETFRALVAEQEKKLAMLAAMDEVGYVPREFELAIPPREYQRFAADMALRTGSLLCADQLGLGKQQPVDAKVLTPSGYVEIGTIKVGDSVTGSDGGPTCVTGVFPQGVKQSYRLTFSDRSSVEAGPEHLWTVNYHGSRGTRFNTVTVTTEQLRVGATIQSQCRDASQGGRLSKRLGASQLYLPMLSGPVQFTVQNWPLPLPPYLLGQLIANGSLNGVSASLTCNTADWSEIRNRLMSDGVEIGAVNVYNMATRAGIPGVMPHVRDLGMAVTSRDKRIPPTYLRSSPASRIALLHGLMDGDGSASKERSRVSYSTTSRGLAEDVVDLVTHLGGVATLSVADRRASGRSIEYNVRVRLPTSIPPFMTSRKMSRYRPSKRHEPTRSLVSVEYVRDVESVCISVDAPDRLYATEHAILTHNTITGICALTAPGALPAVVVTMTHLVRQWERELARFAPALKVHRIRETRPYDFRDVRIEVDPTTRRRKIVHFSGIPDVVLLSYSKIHGWVETLAGRVRSMIIDEAQEFRRSGTRKYTAGKALAEACDLRIALTATPIYNYGNEIFHVMEVVAPGQLGTWKEFLDEWCGGAADMQGRATVNDPAALGAYLRESGLMIRRTRSEVGREIPPLTVVRHVVDCDEDSINRVAEDVAELARRVLDRIGSGIEQMQNARDIDYRMREATGIGKAGAVAEFVRLLVDSGEQVVLSGWHHACYRLWRADFEKHGSEVAYAMYTGEEGDAQKDRARQDFIDGKARVLIISNRSGAGLDGLQKVCRNVVVGELDWSPQVISQLIGRVHRDGQTDPVMAYVLVAETGSDPTISDALGIKEAQSHYLLNPTASGMPEFQGASEPHIRKLAEDVLRRRGKAA